ncbi:MAG: hypothetical protein H6709_06205 [Kofleriaceae bacterium]|nr:hypothetical protein [Myxococcales bacterium]MCB9560403.1 hypothetical protein [Kofleriaceae bacterium]MCB9571667.1 hypothetical protein [Kofleriaceae bacterium]
MPRLPAILFVIGATACGGAEPTATTHQPAAAAAEGDPHAVCVRAFQRQRACTDEFIPALVDARVRLDRPPGIADQDRELGRDQLVAMALEEWHTDSTDDAIEASCTSLQDAMPPDQQRQMTEQVGRCLDADACASFVDCLIPVVTSQLH